MTSEKKIDKKYVETPLMKQYYSIKAVHPDAILLFRVGDFYETFGDDAIKASGILGITLTRRANGSATYVELAGFPYHAIDTYLPKLVRAGERVAICEQLEDPKLVKGLVKRGVIELVTPGIVLGDNILANKENNFIASVYFGRQTTGVAFLDISTGEFYVAEGADSYVDKLISNLQPKEVVYQRGYEDRFSGSFGSKLYTYRLDEWVFSEDVNREKLCKQFGTKSLKGFGVDHFTSGISAAGAILYYLEFTEHRDTGHIASIARIDQDDYVWVDKFTIRNLELFSSNGAREKCSFADVIDRTLTPMGGRLLKRWIAMPIKDPAKINERLDVVERLIKDADLADVIREQVSLVGDLERTGAEVLINRYVRFGECWIGGWYPPTIVREPDMMDQFETLDGVKVLHMSGITPVLSESCLAMTKAAFALAKEKGVAISFDPNIRRKLWRGQDYAPLIRELTLQSEIVLLGLDEADALFGLRDPDAIFDLLFRDGCAQYVAIKDGGNGAWVADKTTREKLPPYPCKPIEPIGAGDGFNAGFLAGILQGRDVVTAGRMGAICGALATQTPGDVEGYPGAAQMEAALTGAAITYR